MIDLTCVSDEECCGGSDHLASLSEIHDAKIRKSYYNRVIKRGHQLDYNYDLSRKRVRPTALSKRCQFWKNINFLKRLKM